MEPSPIILVAVATVLAAFVAAVVSLVSLVNTKEQKTTEFRQEWINALRREIAKFASEARYIAGAIKNAKRFDLHCFSRDSKAYQTYDRNRSEITNAYYQISLHFKPNDQDFVILSRLLNDVMTQLGRPNHLEFSSINERLNEITDFARLLMKTEWERVKSGEPIFKWTKRGAMFIVVLFLCAFLYGAYFLWSKPDYIKNFIAIPTTLSTIDNTPQKEK